MRDNAAAGSGDAARRARKGSGAGISLWGEHNLARVRQEVKAKLKERSLSNSLYFTQRHR